MREHKNLNRMPSLPFPSEAKGIMPILSEVEGEIWPLS